MQDAGMVGSVVSIFFSIFLIDLLQVLQKTVCKKGFSFLRCHKITLGNDHGSVFGSHKHASSGFIRFISGKTVKIRRDQRQKRQIGFDIFLIFHAVFCQQNRKRGVYPTGRTEWFLKIGKFCTFLPFFEIGSQDFIGFLCMDRQVCR